MRPDSGLISAFIVSIRSNFERMFRPDGNH